jgi:hypothetical protein
VIDGVPAGGKALLESEAVIFRGDARARLLFKELIAIDAEDGRLTLTTPTTVAVFDLGPKAERWAAKIRNPRGLIDKLGIKAGARVAVLGIADEQFAAELHARTGGFATGEPLPASDAIFVGVELTSDLPAVFDHRRSLAPAGALWVVYPKGKREITEMDVLNAGRAAGLTDTRVAKFSDTQTALRFVIPRARR